MSVRMEELGSVCLSVSICFYLFIYIYFYLSKARHTHTHRLCDTCHFSTATIVTRTPALIRYMYITCLVIIFVPSFTYSVSVHCVGTGLYFVFK
jgi:hypothetical protein